MTPKPQALFDLVDPVLASDRQKHDRPELRDSKPVERLTEPRAAAIKLGYRKRKRVGPHR